MKLKLVQIGNSLGIRIPKSLLQQCKFKKEVTVTIVNGNLVLSPSHNAREGWEDTFKKMAEVGDDALLDSETLEQSFDVDNWEW